MKLTDNIDSTLVVSLDIEVVRNWNTYAEVPEDFASAWEYKQKNNGQIPSQEELTDLWERNASLYPEFSKICAISLTCFNKDKTKLICMELFGEDEVVILNELNKYLDRLPPGYKLLAHAGSHYDYSFIAKRCIINNLEVANILDVMHLKPWETVNLLDSNTLWKMGGTTGSSLQALCTCLGIPVSK